MHELLDPVPLKLLKLPEGGKLLQAIRLASNGSVIKHGTCYIYSAHVDHTTHKQIALTATRDVISVCSLTYKRKRNSIHAGVVHLAATHKAGCRSSLIAFHHIFYTSVDVNSLWQIDQNFSTEKNKCTSPDPNTEGIPEN